jgi:hypothetical protein
MPSHAAIMPTYLLDPPSVCYQRRVIVRAEFLAAGFKILAFAFAHDKKKTEKALRVDASVRCIPHIIVAIVT